MENSMIRTESQQTVKEAWAKPEIKIMGVNEETLGSSFNHAGDAGSFS